MGIFIWRGDLTWGNLNWTAATMYWARPKSSPSANITSRKAANFWSTISGRELAVNFIRACFWNFSQHSSYLLLQLSPTEASRRLPTSCRITALSFFLSDFEPIDEPKPRVLLEGAAVAFFLMLHVFLRGDGSIPICRNLCIMTVRKSWGNRCKPWAPWRTVSRIPLGRYPSIWKRSVGSQDQCTNLLSYSSHLKRPTSSFI